MPYHLDANHAYGLERKSAVAYFLEDVIKVGTKVFLDSAELVPNDPSSVDFWDEIY